MPEARSRDEHGEGESPLWGPWVLWIPPRPSRSSPPGMRGLSAAAGPGGRFTSEEPGVFMAGWNVCSEHVMNLQRANEWIYFEPTVSELITAAKETFGGTGRGEVALGTPGGTGTVPGSGCASSVVQSRGAELLPRGAGLN